MTTTKGTVGRTSTDFPNPDVVNSNQFCHKKTRKFISNMQA